MGVIYALSFTGEDRRYIGSTANTLSYRMRAHRSGLRRGCHHAALLQEVCNRIGFANLEVRVLDEVANNAILIQREQFWMDKFAGRLLNTSLNAASRAGLSASTETRKRISRSLLGNKHRKGIPHSDDVKAMIRDGIKRAYVEGRHRRAAGNGKHFAKLHDDVARGKRLYPRQNLERDVAIAIAYFRTGSAEQAGQMYGIKKAGACYALRRVRDRIMASMEAAGALCKPLPLRLTKIHPDWLEFAL